MLHEAFNSTVHSNSKTAASLCTSYISTGSVVRENPQDVSGSTYQPI